MIRKAALLALVLASLAPAAPTRAIPPPGAPDCRIFPRSNVWHSDISTLPVHPRSSQWKASMGGGDVELHPDFGPSGEAMPYGIPYETVGGGHPKVSIDFLYDDESDPGPYPFDGDTPIEGGAGSNGDRHAIMIDRVNCILYELYRARWNGGDPTAGSGAVFDLGSNALRPRTWTSADAAGLSIFAGLLRLDEVQAGRVDHAIRMTASCTAPRFIWPARHQAGSCDDAPPMGARFRMRAGFDIDGFREDTKVILRAFKRYGMIVADNGSDWYFQGTAEDGWPVALLDELKSIPASAFVAVDASGIKVDPDSGRVRARNRIARISFDPLEPGLNREWIEIVNRGTNDWNLAGWRVRDDDGNVYVFDRLILRVGARVRLHTGSGMDSRADRYWGRSSEVWDDDGDVARLRRPDGVVHDRCAYGGAGAIAGC